MHLSQRTRIFWHSYFSIALVIAPVLVGIFATPAYADTDEASTISYHEDKYDELQGLYDTAVYRAPLYDVTLDTAAADAALSDYSSKVQDLTVFYSSITSYAEDMNNYGTQLEELPALIQTWSDNVDSTSAALEAAQLTFDEASTAVSDQQGVYDSFVADRDSAESLYLSTAVSTSYSVTETFDNCTLQTGMDFLVDGSTEVTTSPNGNISMANGASGTYVSGCSLKMYNPYKSLQIKPPPNSTGTSFSFAQYAINGSFDATVVFTDESTATFNIPNGVHAGTQADGYTSRVSYSAPSGKEIQSITIPAYGDYYYIDNVSFSGGTTTYDEGAYQSYLAAQADLDDYIATIYQPLVDAKSAASSALPSAQSEYDNAVSNYDTYSAPEYEQDLQDNYDTALNNWMATKEYFTIAAGEAYGAEQIATAAVDALVDEVPPIPTAPAFPQKSVRITLNEGDTETIPVPPITPSVHFTSVLFASYGIQENWNATSCNASTSMEVVQAALDNIQNGSITLAATNAAFNEDPCEGVSKTLQVVLAYEYNAYLASPTNVVATENLDDSITVTWDAPTIYATEVERYAVFFDDSVSNGWAVSSRTTSITLQPSLFEATGGLGKIYNFRIRSDNDTDHVYSSFADAVYIYIAEPEEVTQVELDYYEQMVSDLEDSIAEAESGEDVTDELLSELSSSDEYLALIDSYDRLSLVFYNLNDGVVSESDLVSAIENYSSSADTYMQAIEEATTPEVVVTPTPTIPPKTEPKPTPTPTPVVEEPKVEDTKTTSSETQTQPTTTTAPSTATVKTEPATPTTAPVSQQQEKVVELKEEVSSENIVAAIEELSTIDARDLSDEQVELIVEAAYETFETAEAGSAEYEAALDALMVAAQADDMELPEELAAIPVLGAAAGAVLEVFNDIGNLGSDMSPQVREESEKVVVAAVVVSQVATAAATTAATAIAAPSSGGSTSSRTIRRV